MIPAEERNYYRDIHSIKKSLEDIAKSLRVISESTKPISYVVADPFKEEYGQKEPDSEEQEKLNDSSRENTEL